MLSKVNQHCLKRKLSLELSYIFAYVCNANILTQLSFEFLIAHCVESIPAVALNLRSKRSKPQRSNSEKGIGCHKFN